MLSNLACYKPSCLCSLVRITFILSGKAITKYTDRYILILNYCIEDLTLQGNCPKANMITGAQVKS